MCCSLHHQTATGPSILMHCCMALQCSMWTHRTVVILLKASILLSSSSMLLSHGAPAASAVLAAQQQACRRAAENYPKSFMTAVMALKAAKLRLFHKLGTPEIKMVTTVDLRLRVGPEIRFKLSTAQSLPLLSRTVAKPVGFLVEGGQAHTRVVLWQYHRHLFHSQTF